MNQVALIRYSESRIGAVWYIVDNGTETALMPVMDPLDLARLLRPARSLLGLNVNDLASLSGISRNTILKLERGDLGVSLQALQRAKKSLEAKGVMFLGAQQPAAGPGVCLRPGMELPDHGDFE